MEAGRRLQGPDGKKLGEPPPGKRRSPPTQGEKQGSLRLTHKLRGSAGGWVERGQQGDQGGG